MTFLAPGFFYAALAVAAGVVALHFLVTRQPRAAILPTARFVPDLPATATARATRPSDLLLMLLRALLVLAAGTALARPVFRPERQPVAKVILLDASRAVNDFAAASSSARALFTDGDVFVLFDSAARQLNGSPPDSLPRLTAGNARGNISAALIAALRAGSDMRERADSIELVVISPFAAEEWDAATDSIRKLWRGRARLVRVAMASEPVPRESSSVTIGALSSDALTATMSLVPRSSAGNVRIVRGAPNATDSAWAAAGSRVLVEWPRDAQPRGTVARQSMDSVGGVLAGSSTVISGFVRKWRFGSDSLNGVRVIARWLDGEPAATERPIGEGCLRSVGVPVAQVGDLVIRADFIRFVATFVAPCGNRTLPVPASAASLASLAGPPGLASRDAFEPRSDVGSPLAPWLLGLAIALALGELFARRRETAPTPSRHSPSPRPDGQFVDGIKS